MRTTPWILLLSLAGCSADFSASLGGRADEGPTAGDGDDTDVDGAWDTGGFGGGDADDELPPEQEDDFLALKPAQTDVYVFIANPDRDTVTRVNVETLEVLTTEVGDRPSAVEITPDYTTAVVFNKGDATVSLVDADSLERLDVPVRSNLNRMVLSPSGGHAALWHDPDAVTPEDPPLGGATSFNEVSIVDVATGEHTPLVVGFNPKNIRFTPDGLTALVVSDASLAVVDLVGTPEPTFIEVADPLDPPIAEEVAVAPDGSYAFIRQFGFDELTIVDLLTEAVSTVPVGENPTDLDITPDGTRAVVVSRGAREVAVFDVADPFAPPTVLPIPNDEPLGSVTVGEDDVAILYTTATNTARYATWDLDTDEITLRPLAKPAQQVIRTPTGTSLLVFHTVADADDGSTPEPYQGEHAISLIDLEDFRANTLALADEPTGYANANNGRFGYVILEGQPYMEILDYSSLIYEELSLRSDPVYVGVLPDLDASDDNEPYAWVSQEHPLGRITFYDPDDSSVETITGFELNAAIED